jgi:hypothetical protein
MEISAREGWTVLHGMLFGAAFSWPLPAAWRAFTACGRNGLRRRTSGTDDPPEDRHVDHGLSRLGHSVHRDLHRVSVVPGQASEAPQI